MKESNQGNPDGIACCRLGRKAEGRKEGPNGEWGKREGGGLQKQRASLALHLHPMSTFLSPELHPGRPPWLPSQLDAERHTPHSPLSSPQHLLGPNLQTQRGPCWACLSVLAFDSPKPGSLRTHLHIHSSMTPNAPPSPSLFQLPHRPCPSLLALTSFDQSSKQVGLLFSLGNRSDGS